MDAVEETRLLDRFLATRDPALRESLVMRYVPLVHYVLGRLGVGPESRDYEDLVSQGLLGLVDAVDRYDPSHGTRFSTYAAWRIRGSVLDYLRAMDWLSRKARRRVREAQAALGRLWARMGRAPTQQELAQELGVSLAEVQEILLDASRQIVSLDASLDPAGEAENLHEVLADGSQADPEERLEEAELRARLQKAIGCLPERQQLVLSLYYYEGLTMREIGQVLSVSESRVCQLHAQAVLSLRAVLQEGASESVDHEPAQPVAHRLSGRGPGGLGERGVLA